MTSGVVDRIVCIMHVLCAKERTEGEIMAVGYDLTLFFNIFSPFFLFPFYDETTCYVLFGDLYS